MYLVNLVYIEFSFVEKLKPSILFHLIWTTGHRNTQWLELDNYLDIILIYSL